MRVDELDPKDAKYIRRFGVQKRWSDLEDRISATEYFKALAREIRVNEIDGGDESMLTELAPAMIKDIKKFLGIDYQMREKVSATHFLKDALPYVDNIIYGHRKKSSRTVLGATAVGTGLGLFVAFVALPVVAPYLGATVGGLMAGLGGLVIAVGIATLVKRRGESLAKKWYPEEYHYDLPAKVTRNFKKQFGVPKHAVQLMHGYLNNRMKVVSSAYMQDKIAVLKKVVLENQLEEKSPELIAFFAQECMDVSNTYLKLRDDYHAFKVSTPAEEKQTEKYQQAIEKKQAAMKQLQVEHKLLQTVLLGFKEASVDDRRRFDLPEEINTLMTEKLPDIAQPLAPSRALSSEMNEALQSTTAVLEQSPRIEMPAPADSPVPLNRQPAQGLNIAKSLTKSLTPQDKSRYQAALKECHPELTVEQRGTIDRYHFTEGTAAIDFSQKEKSGVVNADFKMPMAQLSDAGLEQSLKQLLSQITVLVQQHPQRAKQAEIEIKADLHLSEEKRIYSAAFMLSNLAAKQLKTKLVGFSPAEKEKIQQIENAMRTPHSHVANRPHRSH